MCKGGQDTEREFVCGFKYVTVFRERASPVCACFRVCSQHMFVPVVFKPYISY